MKKPSRNIVLIWSGLILTGIIIFFVPILLGKGGQSTGVAVSGLGVFIAILGLILLILYLRLSRVVGNLVKNDNLLARWQYPSPGQTAEPAEEGHSFDRRKRRMWIAASVLLIILGAIFWAAFSEYSLIIILVVLLLIVISGLPFLLSSGEPAGSLDIPPREVIISLDGVYIDGHTHIWKGIGTRLESAVLEEREGSQPQIVFNYSAPARSGRDLYSARVPVPPGQEAAARQIVSDIAARHLTSATGGGS